MPYLLEDRVIAVFDGRSEFGPRALGHRSLLALPRDAAMRDRMNELKHREWYRPVAPAILAEHFDEYFEAPFSSVPYMTLAARCRPIVAERAPAVRHVDNSARPQTVTAEQSPLMFRLLQGAKQATGTPILVNTSFNVQGEPIVETPDEAIASFLGAPLCAALSLGDFVLEKDNRD